jgi:hypothetical protein
MLPSLLMNDSVPLDPVTTIPVLRRILWNLHFSNFLWGRPVEGAPGVDAGQICVPEFYLYLIIVDNTCSCVVHQQLVGIQRDTELLPEHDVWDVDTLLTVDCPDALSISPTLGVRAPYQLLPDDGRLAPSNGGLLVPVVLPHFLVVHGLALNCRYC